MTVAFVIYMYTVFLAGYVELCKLAAVRVQRARETSVSCSRHIRLFVCLLCFFLVLIQDRS
jgi:hypothetical protein